MDEGPLHAKTVEEESMLQATNCVGAPLEISASLQWFPLRMLSSRGDPHLDPQDFSLVLSREEGNHIIPIKSLYNMFLYSLLRTSKNCGEVSIWSPSKGWAL